MAGRGIVERRWEFLNLFALFSGVGKFGNTSLNRRAVNRPPSEGEARPTTLTTAGAIARNLRLQFGGESNESGGGIKPNS